MKKYLRLLKYEMKTLVKERMNLFMIAYPFLMLVIMGYLLPAILKKAGEQNTQTAAITLLIGLIVLLAVGGYIMGAMLGFSLIENKDEKTILNIAVTPITVSGYVMFKVIYTYVIAVAGNIIMVGGLKLLASDAYAIIVGSQSVRLLDNITVLHMMVFALVNAMLVPLIAAIIGGFAKNKIEGFAIVKMGGLLVMIPGLTLLPAFTDRLQYLLGIVPNFWPLKAILNVATNSQNVANLPFAWYMIIGVVYQIIITIVALKLLVKKTS
ncbi:MAG: hypothetical protein AB7T03_04030 [Bacilli bacterium]